MSDQRFQCRDCGKVWTIDDLNEIHEPGEDYPYLACPVCIGAKFDKVRA